MRGYFPAEPKQSGIRKCPERRNMKTDVIVISNDGENMEEALAQAEKVACYKELPSRNAMHLRLLTEEMLGMMRSITGERKGAFWIEDHDGMYELHLQVETPMDFDKQERLLAASTSGKNESARGIMGKIRSFFDPMDWANAPVPVNVEGTNPVASWSISSYRQMVQKKLEENPEGAAEAWDELEKSVVSNLADDVKVSIRGRNVEMTILKRLAAPKKDA